MSPEPIFREVASNLLIHREYSSGVPARLVIEHGKVSTWNASRPHGFGLLDPATAVPYPKNPVIGAFFREIDRADELGSGMRNMWHYGKKYGGAEPQLVEGDVFRMIISVPEFGQQGAAIPYEDVRLEPGRGQVGTKSGTQSGFSWDPVGTQIPPSPLPEIRPLHQEFMKRKQDEQLQQRQEEERQRQMWREAMSQSRGMRMC